MYKELITFLNNSKRKISILYESLSATKRNCAKLYDSPLYHHHPLFASLLYLLFDKVEVRRAAIYEYTTNNLSILP